MSMLCPLEFESLSKHEQEKYKLILYPVLIILTGNILQMSRLLISKQNESSGVFSLATTFICVSLVLLVLRKRFLKIESIVFIVNILFLSVLPFRIVNTSFGEDLNNDGLLDIDEDINSNGTLDPYREVKLFVLLIIII